VILVELSRYHKIKTDACENETKRRDDGSNRKYPVLGRLSVTSRGAVKER
jgi:hypothetical protein